MSRVFKILKDPEYVAKIQNFFGVSSKDSADVRISYENDHRPQENIGMLRKKSNKNLTELDDNKEAGESLKPINGSVTIEETYCRVEAGDKNSPGCRNYKIENKFWYFLFLFGTYLGDDIGYAIILPFWFWNIDAVIGRKIVFVWTLVMYIGQVSKDIIRWPRPTCPPVVRLQKKWSLEYGMPSTHAMVGVALPSSMLYYTSLRYKFPVIFGVSSAFIFCILISLSRLYLGMHSLLDIFAGLLLSSLLVIPFLPLVDYFDSLLHHDWFLLSIIVISIFLIIIYPTGNTWTPTRGDTTVILATCVGIQTAFWFHFRINLAEKSAFSGPYVFHVPDIHELGIGVIRTFSGYLGIVIMFLIFEFTHKVFDCILESMKVTVQDVGTKRRVPHIDLMYKYLTYSITAFNIACSIPFIFRCLNIDRKSYYWE